MSLYNTSSNDSYDSLKIFKYEKLVFHLEEPIISPSIMEMIKTKLWPTWQKYKAVSMDVTKAKKIGHIRITVKFENFCDLELARRQLSVERMRKLFKGVEIGDATIPSNNSSMGKTLLMKKYLGPNGQQQKSVLYKQGQCMYGCVKIVGKDMLEEHRSSCPAYIKYINDRQQYEENMGRKNEIPVLSVWYSSDALEGFENRFGYKWGKGPVQLVKTGALHSFKDVGVPKKK